MDRAAAEAGAGETRAVAAGRGFAEFAEHVEFDATHFEVVAQTPLTLVQQRADAREIAACERVARGVHARVLGQQMARAAE